MICKIEGCNHTAPRQKGPGEISRSWSEYGICYCCFQELIYLGIIKIIGHVPSTSPRCNKFIEKELTNPI